MCGIVAYKGPKLNAGKVVFDGLKLLEYRGYDSSGIAIHNNGNVEVFKKKGKVKNSEKLFKNFNFLIFNDSDTRAIISSIF